MVLSCSAYNCTQRYTKGVSFHGFPKDLELRRKWIQVMRRDGFTPSKQSKLSGKHFTIDCYEVSPWSSQKKLKSDAIPSIFDFPTRLKKSTYSRKPPKNRQSIISNNITNDSIQNNNIDNYIINVNNNITNDSIQNNNVDNCIINVNNIITNDSIQNNISTIISLMNNNVANCQINPKNNGKRYIGDFNENDMLIPENS
ncbi:THAP domain-containing protein 2-like [Hydra vulgaris]|uniref:THAP domain-containing protein 2-like n=1 Tax=Hydra vulgaris TaxID=6087 RepID=UPI0032EA5F49